MIIAEEYLPNLHVLKFDNRLSLGYGFCRLSEHFESPKFKNKIFTIKEFQEYYKKWRDQTNFSYCYDVDGFNIPDYVFDSFFNHKFDPLSQSEKNLLEIVQNFKKPFYVIGLMRKSREFDLILKHEVAHGLFYLNSDYKQKILQILSQIPPKVKKTLKLGFDEYQYHTDQFLDEIQAYGQDSMDFLRHFHEIYDLSPKDFQFVQKMLEEIQQTFKEFNLNAN